MAIVIYCVLAQTAEGTTHPARPPCTPGVARRTNVAGNYGCVCDGSASTKIVASIYLRIVICPRATTLR
jgi:hypothetical protein